MNRHSFTNLVGDPEAVVGDRVVRLEPDVDPAAGGHVLWREVGAAVPPHQRGVGGAAVTDLHEIVSTDQSVFDKATKW